MCSWVGTHKREEAVLRRIVHHVIDALTPNAAYHYSTRTRTITDTYGYVGTTPFLLSRTTYSQSSITNLVYLL
jgi:hypothetical protein